MIYVLDTNAWVAYFRGNQDIRKRLAQHSPTEIQLCSIVLGELYYGAYHSGPGNVAKNLQLISDLLAVYDVLDFDCLSADSYGTVRQHLQTIGLPIGSNDMLIASCVLAHQYTAVNANIREFSRVPNLLVENWQIP